MEFVELNNDQRREAINSRQRFEAWRQAWQRALGYRGSMVWSSSKGADYLLRSYYDENGKRRQKSLGRRSDETEAIKQAFDGERDRAFASRDEIDRVLDRQAAINRALGLGRVPLTPARIVRVIDRRGLLGSGLKIAGTNALYAYEAACGVFVDAEITSTGDIDLLFDARRHLHLVVDPEIREPGLLAVLEAADRSFRKTDQTYSASNDEGYQVDLIKPAASPPWKEERNAIADNDLKATEIEGLAWLENAPSFEQIVIDEKGYPLRMVSPDPRVFSIHKFWLSGRADRDPLKRRRDKAQSDAVAALVRQYMPHLPFEAGQLRMVPKRVFEDFTRQATA